jgi:chromosome partitioning protein
MDMKAGNDALRLTGRQPISIDTFADIDKRCSKVVDRVRSAMLAPTAVKTSPVFHTAQLGAIVGLDNKQVDYRARKGDLPSGSLTSAGRRRVFTLPELRRWSQDLRKAKLRPEGGEAVTVVTANFKGGVTKTTTAVTLAQGLSMRGHKVLLIDADPQGSATTLFGLLPGVEVTEDQTILPLCRGEADSIEYAIRQTYWDGIDLVPAMNGLFSAEFDLPSRQMTSKGFEFWNVLHNGIDTARLKYDVIIVDTPPSLSYITINAIMAADGLVMPLPPSTLDFLSSVQFWSLVSDLTQGLQEHGATKKFDFIDVILSKVKADDTSTAVVRDWIASAYGEKVIPVEIPDTSTAGSASAQFGTVYDQTRKQATQAYDRMVDFIEEQIGTAWLRQVASVHTEEQAA